MSTNDIRIFPVTDYDAILEETITKIKSLGILKGGEYAGDIDRLANFRRHADQIEIPYELVWRIYAGKHWDSINQYVKDIMKGHSRVRLESLDGRVDDLIVYLLLFKCMLREAELAAKTSRPFAASLGEDIKSNGN